MDNLKEFVSKSKSMLIAPAGYGKTHTIVECLKLVHSTNRQLILTHTHAGVASIKEKIKKERIPSFWYNVETITSFAQKYVLAFYRGPDLPNQDNKTYFPFVVSKAIEIFKKTPIINILKNSYSHLFVDEYQDCTTDQHSLILALSEILPTHIFGDPLQGIFEFGGQSMTDLTSEEHMGDFLSNKYELSQPWRWKKHNRVNLGNDLKAIRAKLIDKQNINLRDFPSIELKIINDADLFKPSNSYSRGIWNLVEEPNLLLIHPDSTNISSRLKIISTYKNKFNIVEAIDDKDFYKLSQMIDVITIETVGKVIRDVCLQIFNKTTINNWFNENGVKNKTKENERLIANLIKEDIVSYKKSPRLYIIRNILNKIKKLPDIKCYRNELFRYLCMSIDEAEIQNMTVFDAMKTKRNSARRLGRKVGGKCIGTTLLTKGLEFDTVGIINAHRFKCPKNLYVALTRATNRLIIFTNDPVLRPYGQP